MPTAEITAGVTVGICLSLLACQMALLLRGERIDVMGRPPLPRPAFFVAKLSLATSVVCLVARAITGPAPDSPIALTAFFALLLGGTAVLALAFHRLGLNLRMGLPTESTTLVSGGIYRYSRNPIYLGLFGLVGASVIYAFSLLNLAAAAVSIVLHHRIVLSEERFLSARFPEYEAYRRSVPRYL